MFLNIITPITNVYADNIKDVNNNNDKLEKNINDHNLEEVYDEKQDEKVLLPVRVLDLFGFSGSAREGEKDSIILTPDEKSRIGTAYLKDSIDMTKDFTINIHVDAGKKKKGEYFADGIGLAFHKSPKNSLGLKGGGLGILGLSGGIGYEFDTYDHSKPEDEDYSFGHNKWREPHRGFVSTDAHKERLTALAPMTAFESVPVDNEKEEKFEGNMEYQWNSNEKILSAKFTNIKGETIDLIKVNSIYTGSFYNFIIGGASGIYSNKHTVRINNIDFSSKDSGKIIIKYKDIKTGKK